MAPILLVEWEYFGTQWKGKWQWCTFIYSVHWYKRAITVISPCRVAKTNSKYGICLLIKHIPASWVQPAGQQPPYWCAVCPGDFSWREALWRSQLHIISFKWPKWWEGQSTPPLFIPACQAWESGKTQSTTTEDLMNEECLSLKETPESSLRTLFLT